MASIDNQDLIKIFLDKSSDLKLPKNTKFLFQIPGHEQSLVYKQIIKFIKNEKIKDKFEDQDDDTKNDNSKNDGDTKNGAKKEEKIYHIIGLNDDFGAFLNLLRFVYDDEMVDDKLILTYYAAKKYSINNLIQKLEQAIQESTFKIDDCTLIYDYFLNNIDKIDNDRLKKIELIICVHAFLAFQSIDFLFISKETLIKILDNNSLFIKEKDLYYACLYWCDAQLKIKNLDNNLENRKNLFNEIKKHIRFNLFTKCQFNTEHTKMVKAWSNGDEKEPKKSPLFSGLLDDHELELFKQYFDTKSEDTLNKIKNELNYSIEPRKGLKIGKLKLRCKDDKKLFFEMITNLDEILEKNKEEVYIKPIKLLNENLTYSNMSAESRFIDEGSDDERFQNEAEEYTRPKERKEVSKPVDKSTDLKDEKIRSIKMFKFYEVGSSSGWDYGVFPIIYENGVRLKDLHYKKYIVDGGGFFGFYPFVELKEGHKYEFEFITPGEGVDTNLFDLERIYSKTIEGEKLDIHLTVKYVDWEHPEEIFFLY